ncbi:MAG: flavin reductase [Emergencia sp.]
MDNKALYKLSYGVFLLTTKSDSKVNGCITNTCIQVANSPTRVAIAVLNTNYTCDLIKESGIFTVSLLDDTCKFETIKHFGMQSGRDVDKFEYLDLPKDLNGVPYLGWQTCAVISCKVVEQHELGSHTLFIGEIEDAQQLSDNAPLTYADYQNHVKPKPAAKPAPSDKKIVGWRCKICSYVYEGSELPDDYLCPLCGHGKDDFEPIYE